ncbi:MAG TPA: arylsulfotransferase family protein [Solirubrobacteraceae bacterium]|nr:arylsulfotransferase family protein [Solirubrobacteraceae bacterium]
MRVSSHSYMRRKLLIILGLVATAALVWGVLAVVLDSPTLKISSGSSANADSPECLPRTLGHSATLPGTNVDVSPAPESETANARTQVSFLGAPAAQITHVSVSGEHSGEHAGKLSAYSQGDGASFAPTKPFAMGEHVTVSATIGAGASAKHVAFGFRVDSPYSTAHTTDFENLPASPADLQSFYTLSGAQPPVMTVTTADRDPKAGDIFTTNGPGPGQYGPLIYTPQGRLVWFQRLPNGEAAEDLNVQTYEGRRVLTWWRGHVLSLGFGQGEDVVMSSGYETLTRVRGGNGLKADLHDFRVLPGGVAYITAYNPIRCDLSSVGGTRGGAIVDTAIQQIDMRTGLVRWEWHSLDHVGADESEVEAPEGKTPWDYFHINSIDPQLDGNLLISARSTWAGYQLERGSGKVLWRLGGNRSSFKMGAGTKMAWQHDGRMLSADELTFFDDGSNPPIHKQSRGLRIKLDLARHEARLIKAYTHPDPPLLAASQGNMQTLASGNALLGYGGVPAISEFSPDGRLLFDAHQPYDMSFYRAFRYPWSATPATPPSILVTQNDTGEETVIHASWNGATGVSAWRVLAGQNAGALTVQAQIPVSGFETSVTLPRKFAYASVQALDASGHTLGTSKPSKAIGYYSSLSIAKGSR